MLNLYIAKMFNRCNKLPFNTLHTQTSLKYFENNKIKDIVYF